MGQKGEMGPKGILGDNGEQVHLTVDTTNRHNIQSITVCREIMETQEYLECRVPRE